MTRLRLLKPGAIAGVDYFSTVDWPGKIASTLFFRGCPWSCDYCHNADLISFNAGESAEHYEWSSVYAELIRRVKFNDGVVFTGGEPLAQPLLADLMTAVKDLGLLVGLHTNGVNPARLKEILAIRDAAGNRLVDWVGLDIKAPRELYVQVTHSRFSGEQAFESLRVVKASSIDYEVRTTLDPQFFTSADVLLQLAKELYEAGVSNWVLQRCRNNDGAHEFKHLSLNLEELVDGELTSFFRNIVIR